MHLDEKINMNEDGMGSDGERGWGEQHTQTICEHLKLYDKIIIMKANETLVNAHI